MNDELKWNLLWCSRNKKTAISMREIESPKRCTELAKKDDYEFADACNVLHNLLVVVHFTFEIPELFLLIFMTL